MARLSIRHGELIRLGFLTVTCFDCLSQVIAAQHGTFRLFPVTDTFMTPHEASGHIRQYLIKTSFILRWDNV